MERPAQSASTWINPLLIVGHFDAVTHMTPTAGPRRDAQRATAESLRQQIHTCRQEITRLRAENHQLRDQLARRLGNDRVAAITKQPF